MTNHTIKAKRKIDGQIMEFTVMDVGFEYKYYENIKTTKPNPNGDIRLPAYLTQQEFNDLFEVVEDKFKVGDKVRIKGEEKVYIVNNSFGGDTIVINDLTTRLHKHKSELELIPQTNTLNKEDRFTDEAIDKRTKDFCKLTGIEEPKIKYDTDTLKKEDWEEKILNKYIVTQQINGFTMGGYADIIKDIKEIITQEITKAREERDSDNIEKIKNYMPELVAIDKDVIIEIIQNNK
jgi:hypothetical protein